MTNNILCAKIRKRLSRLLRIAYGKNFEALLEAREHQLWILVIDSDKRRFLDLCGVIPSAEWTSIQDRGFFDGDAGYRVSAHEKLGLSTPFDAFLINKAHLALHEKSVDPLIVHELAHFLEQLHVPAELEANDAQNAEAILKSLHRDVRNLHSIEWAQHLAAGARVMIQKKVTSHQSIRSFLEAANPHYDRETSILATKGW